MTPARIIAAICVIVPFVAVLWVPIYDKDKPEVAGFPFFFWWQLLWVAITAGLMGLAYFVVRREEVSRKAVAASGNVSETAESPQAEATEAESTEAESTDTAEAADDSTEEGDAQ